jgi:hypothetical protein
MDIRVDMALNPIVQDSEPDYFPEYVTLLLYTGRLKKGSWGPDLKQENALVNLAASVK